MGKVWVGESPGRWKSFLGLEHTAVLMTWERQGRSRLKIGTVYASERTPPLVFFSPVASKMATPPSLQSTATVTTSRTDRSHHRETKSNAYPALHLQTATLPAAQKSTAFHSLLRTPCQGTLSLGEKEPHSRHARNSTRHQGGRVQIPADAGEETAAPDAAPTQPRCSGREATLPAISQRTGLQHHPSSAHAFQSPPKWQGRPQDHHRFLRSTVAPPHRTQCFTPPNIAPPSECCMSQHPRHRRQINASITVF